MVDITAVVSTVLSKLRRPWSCDADCDHRREDSAKREMQNGHRQSSSDMRLFMPLGLATIQGNAHGCFISNQVLSVWCLRCDDRTLCRCGAVRYDHAPRDRSADR